MVEFITLGVTLTGASLYLYKLLNTSTTGDIHEVESIAWNKAYAEAKANLPLVEKDDPTWDDRQRTIEGEYTTIE